MKPTSKLLFCGAALLTAQASQAALLDVYESPDLTGLYGKLETISTAQTGAQQSIGRIKHLLAEILSYENRA